MRTLTLPSRPHTIGDASVVIADARWAHIIGALLFAKTDPPQDVVLVSNAPGTPSFATTVVGALRGGGWNVATYIEEPPKKLSEVVATSAAATVLGKTFDLTPRKAGSATILRLGLDALPASGSKCILAAHDDSIHGSDDSGGVLVISSKRRMAKYRDLSRTLISEILVVSSERRMAKLS